MRMHRLGTQERRGRERRALGTRWWRAQLAGVVVVLTTVILAAPAHAASNRQASPVSSADRGALVGLTDEHPLLGKAMTARGGLPFARPDLSMLVLGGVVVIMAAAGAPLLLRPLRGRPPMFVTGATPSEALVPISSQGAVARATT